eukprot:87035-Prymnesium_polylepis.1
MASSLKGRARSSHHPRRCSVQSRAVDREAAQLERRVADRGRARPQAEVIEAPTWQLASDAAREPPDVAG